MSIFKGCAVAMVTAFNDKKGSTSKQGINLDAQKNIIEHLIKGGVDGIVVCGTTGEPSTMTHIERDMLVEFTVKTVNKRIPVIVGSGGNDTLEAIEFSKKAEYLGADALMIVTPYYNKCTQKGLFTHFKAINDAVKSPIIAYNVPPRTGMTIKPETALDLSNLKNIVAIKEASGDIHEISKIIKLTKGKMDLYSGYDSLTVPAVSLGALGVISVAANVVPHLTKQVAHLSLQGDFKGACEVHYQLAPLMDLLFCEVNPIPAKKALEFMGFGGMQPRLPLTEMETKNADKLKAELVNLGIL